MIIIGINKKIKISSKERAMKKQLKLSTMNIFAKMSIVFIVFCLVISIITMLAYMLQRSWFFGMIYFLISIAFGILAYWNYKSYKESVTGEITTREDVS
jgi:predicted membrane channel-forming protein YqfA (hemolysin III family)